MTALLSRLFIKNHEKTDDPKVRAAYGTMVGIIGVFVNLLLFAGKLIIGLISGSLAVMADALNNLSDAGSSVISFVSFRIAAKPADRDHPFGHARIEYIASMIVSFLILLMGFECASDALTRIFAENAPVVFYLSSVIVLGASILAKLFLAYLNRSIGKRIDSEVMRATAVDCLSDTVSTAAVLLSSLVLRFFKLDIDAYVGLAVSILIFVAGVRILLETKNSLLGEGPVAEVTEGIKRLVSSYPAVLGIHDLLVHSYGPGHTFASLHCEVDGNDNVYDSHDMIDEIERRIHEELGILCTIHMDPLVTDDELTNRLHQITSETVKEAYPDIRIHDFRIVAGPTHTNLIFDLEVPFEIKLEDSALSADIAARIHAKDSTLYAVITVDRA